MSTKPVKKGNKKTTKGNNSYANMYGLVDAKLGFLFQ